MPLTDAFKDYTTTLSDPIANAAALAPDDTSDLSHLTRALYIGVAGDVRVTLGGGDVVTFAAMSSGWHPIRAARLHATGTTATHIIGCY